MMRVFDRRCAVTVAVVRVSSLVTLVMLKRRGVVAVVVIEAAVWVHDDPARLVQRV